MSDDPMVAVLREHLPQAGTFCTPPCRWKPTRPGGRTARRRRGVCARSRRQEPGRSRARRQCLAAGTSTSPRRGGCNRRPGARRRGGRGGRPPQGRRRSPTVRWLGGGYEGHRADLTASEGRNGFPHVQDDERPADV